VPWNAASREQKRWQMRPNLRRPNRYTGCAESQPIHAFNALILQDFLETSVFCNWLLRRSLTKRYMGLQRIFAEIAPGFDGGAQK
jgi:hypothetical protein